MTAPAAPSPTACAARVDGRDDPVDGRDDPDARAERGEERRRKKAAQRELRARALVLRSIVTSAGFATLLQGLVNRGMLTWADVAEVAKAEGFEAPPEIPPLALEEAALHRLLETLHAQASSARRPRNTT